MKEEFDGLRHAEKEHVVTKKPVNFRGKKQIINAKYIRLPHLDIKCKLSVMRDFIACTCHSLPSQALQNRENSPC